MESKPREKFGRAARVDKFAERRVELGQAALTTLAELGYARTSLREIAENSKFSHGVLHYYFKDKVDLIVCSVRQYKSRCMTRYDAVVAKSTSYDELMTGFTACLGDTVRDEAPLHRLWYDLRSQSLFEEAFRADVLEIDAGLEKMVWRIVTRFSEFAGAAPKMSASATYALFDGLFQRCLLNHIAGDLTAIGTLQQEVRIAVPQLLGTPLVIGQTSLSMASAAT